MDERAVIQPERAGDGEPSRPPSGRRGPGIVGVIAALAAVGIRPEDPEEERLRKASLTLAAAMVTAAGLLWGAMYALLGLRVPAAFPLGYSVVSLVTFAYFAITKRYRFFRFIQLLLWLLLPFLLQLSLGGTAPSGVVGVWSFMAPVGALLFASPGEAFIWLAGFVGEAVALGFLDARPLFPPAAISPGMRAVFFSMNIGSLAVITLLLMRYFVQGREQARQRSERLLLNILPGPIAERLKRDASTIADRYDEVTVLFADIVNFTAHSAGIEPQRLVTILNDVFTEFDRLAERFGLEKIKTIGDAYMVVGGLPAPRPDHAQAVAEMGLAMLDCVQACAARAGIPITLRIGIHTGPVVAGVIGRRKFSYDLWGDTVNTASRMESHGVPGRVQVTAETYRRLRGGYAFEQRGTVQVKGKGEMMTYFLTGQKET